MARDCCVGLPHDATGLSAVCDCGISCSYSLTVLDILSEVKKRFSYSTQLITKFQLLIKTKIPTNREVSCLKSLRYCIYPAYKC